MKQVQALLARVAEQEADIELLVDAGEQSSAGRLASLLSLTSTRTHTRTSAQPSHAYLPLPGPVEAGHERPRQRAERQPAARSARRRRGERGEPTR